MNDHRILKIVAIYLLLSGAMSVWYGGGSIVSGGHVGTLLGSVCPISNPHPGIGKTSETENDNCPRLVAKVKALNSSSTGVGLFAIIYGLVSVIIAIGIWVFQGGSKETSSAKTKV
jgi:hypothetical protein